MNILKLNLRTGFELAVLGSTLAFISPVTTAALIPGNGLPPGTIPPVKIPIVPIPIPRMPDLIISSLVLDPPVIQPDGTFRVPFTATIANTGTAPAGSFAVGAEFMDPLYVPGRQWFGRPYQPTPSLGVIVSHDGNALVQSLPANFAIAIYGSFYFGLDVRGHTVHLRLHADDEESTEFLPWYIRVYEKNENNNYSPEVWVTFPG